MKRAVLEGPGVLRILEDGVPEPEPGEALVRVERCGICGSDIHSFLGQHPLVAYPVTPGHEFSGTVTRVGRGLEEALVGRNVCVEPSITCGRCPQCQSGRYNICSDLKVMGFQAPGAFCEFVSVPVQKLHILPEGVGFDEGALAEPMAVGVHALGRSGASSGGNILVIGTGVIGLMVVTAAHAAGIGVFAVEADRARAKVARSLGAEEVFSLSERLPRELAGALEGRQLQSVFECVGRADTADMAIRLAPRGSTVVIIGVFPESVPIPMSLVQDGELDVRGTLMYTGDDFEMALDLLGKGALRPADFITQRFPLEELERGYRTIVDPKTPTLKVMVEPGG